jgi:molecular chaperone DnaK (HSP70)
MSDEILEKMRNLTAVHEPHGGIKLPPIVRPGGIKKPSHAKGIVIAIDFGTTFSGVAYSCDALPLSESTVPLRELRQLIRSVDIIRSWPNPDHSYIEKTATKLAYANEAVVAWGGTVKETKHSTIVEYFKLGLHEMPARSTQADSFSLHGFAADPNWKHPDLPNSTAEDYTADFLKHFYEEMQKRLPFGPKFREKNQIDYVLTVPAIWTDKAKDITRTAAIRAGIPEDNLHLITEPEAAAVYCATLCDQVDLQKGDSFVVCDAGGGTVVPNLPGVELILGFDFLCCHVVRSFFCQGMRNWDRWTMRRRHSQQSI